MTERTLPERLHHALTTAQNDDLSKPGTQERARHCERDEAIRDAIDALDAKSALLAEAVTALEQTTAETTELRKLIIERHEADPRYLMEPRYREAYDKELARIDVIIDSASAILAKLKAAQE